MKKFLSILSLLFFSSFVFAACDQLYATGLTKPTTTTELCNIFYVVAYDQARNRPVFSSERLVHGAPVGTISRLNSFKADPRITNGPTNGDYSHSGFDRGHLAPAGDASTKEEEAATFYLSNMTPQQPTVNRNSWRMLEEKTRSIFAKSKFDVYVINIPIYTATPLKMGTVPIPTGYWKVVIHDGITQTFYAANTPNAPVTEHTGIDWKTLIQ